MLLGWDVTSNHMQKSGDTAGILPTITLSEIAFKAIFESTAQMSSLAESAWNQPRG